MKFKSDDIDMRLQDMTLACRDSNGWVCGGAAAPSQSPIPKPDYHSSSQTHLDPHRDLIGASRRGAILPQTRPVLIRILSGCPLLVQLSIKNASFQIYYYF